MLSSLCNLCVLCASVVIFLLGQSNHRGTETTEFTQRRASRNPAFALVFHVVGGGLGHVATEVPVDDAQREIDAGR